MFMLVLLTSVLCVVLICKGGIVVMGVSLRQFCVCDFVVLSVVELCIDYGGVNVFHVCLDFGVVYGVGVCANVCGVVCVVV